MTLEIITSSPIIKVFEAHLFVSVEISGDTNFDMDVMEFPIPKNIKLKISKDTNKATRAIAWGLVLSFILWFGYCGRFGYVCFIFLNIFFYLHVFYK